mgnify:CR=1 FL=1
MPMRCYYPCSSRLSSPPAHPRFHDSIYLHHDDAPTKTVERIALPPHLRHPHWDQPWTHCILWSTPSAYIVRSKQRLLTPFLSFLCFESFSRSWALCCVLCKSARALLFSDIIFKSLSSLHDFLFLSSLLAPTIGHDFHAHCDCFCLCHEVEHLACSQRRHPEEGR